MFGWDLVVNQLGEVDEGGGGLLGGKVDVDAACLGGRRCRESSVRFRFLTHSTHRGCPMVDLSYPFLKADLRLHSSQFRNLIVSEKRVWLVKESNSIIIVTYRAYLCRRCFYGRHHPS